MKTRNPQEVPWENPQNIEPRQFDCGFCGRHVASSLGYSTRGGSADRVYVCPNCRCATYFFGNQQTPSPPFGNRVAHTPTDVDQIYEEARRSFSASAFTGAVMLCRKLLMHIAQSKGANPNETFKHYVDWLDNNHYVPPGSKEWIDSIRKLGNEANHELSMKSREEAEQAISFVEMLLKFLYEYPERVRSPGAAGS